MRLAALIFAVMITPAAAQEVGYIGAKGECSKLVIAGQDVQCFGVGLLSQTNNGRVQVQLPLMNDSILMFSGVRDGMANGIPAIAVDTMSVGDQRFSAEGGCLVSVNETEMFFGCDATDPKGQVFAAYFKGDVVAE